jgi:hypothetical protein
MRTRLKPSILHQMLSRAMKWRSMEWAGHLSCLAQMMNAFLQDPEDGISHLRLSA